MVRGEGVVGDSEGGGRGWWAMEEKGSRQEGRGGGRGVRSGRQ